MPTALVEIPAATILDAPPHKRWTREQVEAIESTGLLAGEKLELIEGELIDKMGKNQPHVLTVMILVDWLRQAFGFRFVLQEAPLEVSRPDRPWSQPEPDALVLRRDVSAFTKSAPGSDDLLLVAEVSDTTLRFDLTAKAALYARAGIQEYWVLDIAARRVIVHRDPVNGQYASVIAYAQTETIAPISAPDKAVPVNDLFAGQPF